MREILSLDRLQAMTPEEAAALLVYRRAEGAGDLDADVLAEWLRLDPTHADAWRSAQTAWADFDEAEGDELLDALRFEARRAGPARPRWRLPAMAAALALAIGAALWFGSGPGGEGSGPPRVAEAPPAASADQTYANAGAAPERFRLADGSWMVLDAGAEAKVALAASRRDVRLVRGRAFFDVARQARRPFAVTAGDQEIVALGTRFEVRLRSGETRVVLVEGRVSVGAGEAPPTILQPGQQLLARPGEAPEVSPADPEEALAWHERYVVFDNVTLAEAAATLSRDGSARLVVRDPAVAALRISGRFRTGDVPRFGRSLALVHPVRVVERGRDEWEIVPAR